MFYKWIIGEKMKKKINATAFKPCLVVLCNTGAELKLQKQVNKRPEVRRQQGADHKFKML